VDIKVCYAQAGGEFVDKIWLNLEMWYYENIIHKEERYEEEAFFDSSCR
jgi:hypothetical protein